MNSRIARAVLALMSLIVVLSTVTACSRGASGDRAAAEDSLAPERASVAASAADVEVQSAAMAYVDAVNTGDLDALVAAFAADAVITDVSRPIAGAGNIRAWAGSEVIGGSLEVLEVVEDRTDGQKLLVHWAPGGSEGWQAHYDFTMSDGVITAADLQYA